MSTEPPQSTHGGPAYPWETFLDGLEAEVGREELAAELVADGVRAILPAALDMVDAAIARGELSTDGEAVRAASRQSNLNKSVNSATAANQAVENSGGEERPTNEELVQEFAKEYPDRVSLPLVKESEGVEVRTDYADVVQSTWTENQPDTQELEFVNPVRGQETVGGCPYEWGEAVRTLLEKYERTKQTTINLEKGSWRTPEVHAEFSVQAENRWFASYQKKYFAQLDAWLRELCGGQRPSGGETVASFDSPRVALLTRSASSTPDGERVGPVEHAAVLQESWESVYHSLRNTLRSEGYELGDDWQYDRRLEPHDGKRGDATRTNEAYAHEHIVVVVDGDVDAGDLWPVIEKHVEACEWAGEAAHGEEAIEVREPDELNDVAAYVADYCSIEPVELWERSPAYLGWAAAMDAGNVRTVSRSEAAREAAKVDACRQEYESGQSEQSEPHGGSVQRVDGQRVCVHCGCSHGISQEGTLAGHRRDGPDVAADGGVEVLDAEARQEELRERWADAEAAVVVGETLERSSRRADIERELEREPEATPLAVVARLGLPPDCRELVAEVKAGIGPSGGGLRDGERESAGRSLSGKSLGLGGGCDWCPACHTEEPESESCPHPEYEEHPLVEGREDADVEVTTGNGGYRGNGHIPFVYDSAPVHDGEPVSFDERAPSWHVKSVTVEGEERPASAGNGIEMVEVTPEVLELPESVTLRGGASELVFECEECGFVSSAVRHMKYDVAGAHRGGNSRCK